MLFLLPFLLILPGFWGQTGVWASMPLADVLSSIVTLWFIRRFLKYYRGKTGNTWRSLPGRSNISGAPFESFLKDMILAVCLTRRVLRTLFR